MLWDYPTPITNDDVTKYLGHVETLSSRARRASALSGLCRALTMQPCCPAETVTHIEEIANDCGGHRTSALDSLASLTARNDDLHGSGRLLLLSLESQQAEESSWLEEDLLAAICSVGSDEAAESARKALLHRAHQNEMVPAVTHRLTQAAIRLIGTDYPDFGHELLAAILIRIESLPLTEDRAKLYAEVVDLLLESPWHEFGRLLAARSAWASTHVNDKKDRIGVLMRVGTQLVDAGYDEDAKAILAQAVQAAIRSDDAGGLLLDCFDLSNELMRGKELVELALSYLDRSHDYSQLAHHLNSVMIWLPNVCNPTQEWFNRCCNKLLELAQKVGGGYDDWVRIEFQRGHVRAFDWGTSASDRFDRVITMEERVSSKATTDAEDHFSTATNLSSASRMLWRA